MPLDKELEMDTSNIDFNTMDGTTSGVEPQQIVELRDLQLALVGGGIGDAIRG
jgi:hypothetical protein